VNKTDLIELVAADSGLQPSDAAKVIDSMLTAVTNTLTKGEDVTIPGFGKFSTVQRAARTGRNPATGAELEIKAATAPKFNAAAGLKAAVNTNYA
jgi:DNA-binding protein HU-beta